MEPLVRAPASYPAGPRASPGNSLPGCSSRGPAPGRLLLHVSKLHTATGPNAAACGFHSGQETRIILETVLEPVVLTLEPDQDTRRLPMAGNEHLFLLRESEKARQGVPHFREGRPFHLLLPSFSSHPS